MNREGFTLTEVMMTAAIFAALASAFVAFLPSVQTSFRRIQVGQQMRSDSATAMDTMSRILRSSKAGTVAICSCGKSLCGQCAANPAAPNSQIDFQSQNGPNGEQWAIWWDSNQLFLVENAGAGNETRKVLASNVGSVTFTGDSRDFSIVNISLMMSAVVDPRPDANGNPLQVITSILPTQSIRMITTQ